MEKGGGGCGLAVHLVADASEMLLDEPLHEVDDSLPLGIGLRSWRYVLQKLTDVLLNRLCRCAGVSFLRVACLEVGRNCLCVS